MQSNEIRTKFIEFFKERGHQVLPSASLVPENDPTVLFTTAGMHPLVPFLLGAKHPEGKRLTNSQKCIRTDDIDEVGDKIHQTFFEMLGNWSLGDYGRKEAIEMSFDFLTKELQIDLNKLAVTCYEGDRNVPKDDESFEIWRSLGIPEKRIKFLGKKDNWWGPAGIQGPCGPDTEMFYWVGAEEAPAEFVPEDKNWVEIWNDVFMELNKVFNQETLNQLKLDKEINISEENFDYISLEQKNIDTGMGMERVLAILNGFDDNYKTDLFWPIIEEIAKISGGSYDTHTKNFRIISDHIKAATFAISDGALPSNKGTGYIVRRLIRRAIVKAHELGISDNFTTKLADKVIEIYRGVYSINADIVKSELEKEESKFRITLKNGLRELDFLATSKISHDNKEWESAKLSPDLLFKMYQSFGIPLEIALEEARRRNIPIEDHAEKTFHVMVENHQELSRTASAGMFKGGLADNKVETTRLHTAAHLLLAALRKVLSPDVSQKGSNITEERLRFDFNHPEKMTPEQIDQVEKLVNAWIDQKLPVTMEELTVEEAKKSGATGVFDDRYGDRVKVYTIGIPSTHSTGSGSFETVVSKEICGGPHVENTSELGEFKITKEESSSAGVRRIKAVLK
jgi:alanyl-tRNA synthetase